VLVVVSGYASNAFGQEGEEAPAAPAAPVAAAPVAAAPVAAAPAPAPAATQPALAPEPLAAAAPEERAKPKKHKRQAEAGTARPAGETPTDSFTGDPFGDEMSGMAAGPLAFRMLLQTRYRQTFATASRNPRRNYALREDTLVHDGDGFELNRLFLRAAAEPLPELGFKAILDFSKLSNPKNVLKQAYVTVRPVGKRVEIAAGILKLPYSTMELDPIARYELSALGATDDLIKKLGFAGRDIGAELMVAPLPSPKWLRVSLGAFAGHAKDEQASPLGAIGARLESKPFKGLRLGVDAVGMPTSHDYKRPFETSSKDVLPLPPDPLYPRERRWAAGKAYSADVTYERHHFTLRGEGLIGDRVDVDERYGARSFWAFWALLAYDIHVGGFRCMPALRAEWLDLDRDHGVGGRRELRAGVAFPYKKRVRFLVDVARSDIEAGTPVIDSPKPLPAVPYFDLDSTRVTAQLQVEL
jgi:hypothetical protein